MKAPAGSTGGVLPSWMVVACATAWFFSLWTANPFGAQGFSNARFTRPTPNPGAFTEVSNAIVAKTVFFRSDESAPTRFMVLTEPNRLEEVRKFLGEGHPRLGKNAVPYYSQFGLQGDVSSVLARALGEPTLALAVFRIVLTLACALALGVFAGRVYRTAGPLAALAVLLVMGLSDWMIIFAQSIYFVVFLNFLAFALPWLLLGGGSARRSTLAWAVAAHGAIVFVRSLCGYEYLTCLILAPLPALAYAAAASSPRPWRQWFLRSTVFGVAGVAGFAVALAAHFGKAVTVEGLRPQEALAFLAYRSKDNTQMGLGAIDYAETDRELRRVSAVYRQFEKWGLAGPDFAKVFLTAYRSCAYLAGHALTLPGRVGVPFGVFLGAVTACLGLYAWKCRRHPSSPARSAMTPWLAATAAAAVTSFSWYVMAFNHSMIHTYYNLVCAFFAFVPVATVFCVKVLEPWPADSKS